MSTENKREDLVFDSTIKENSKGAAILGRISGPCADIVSATRNGRRYSEKLWQKVFADPIVKEYFEAGGIFGELNHPADRDETDLEKVAICMPEPPVKDSNGKLIGYWDILNTPNGRIAKCLFDYGYKLGISSRGSGETFIDYDGQESVDPESYTLQGFDLVYLPAVKAARLHAVNESLETKSLRKALNEAFEQASDEEKKIMTETLNTLEIDYGPVSEKVEPENEIQEDVVTDAENNKNDNSEEILAAEDSGASMFEELQEALTQQASLECEIKALQEKLSVCYTKEARYSDVLGRVKNELNESTITNKQLLDKVADLETKSATQVNEMSELTTKVEKQGNIIKNLKESLKADADKVEELNIELSRSRKELSNLHESYSSMELSMQDKIDDLTVKNSALEQKLEESFKDAKIIRSQNSAKINEAKQLVERYKNIAKTAVDKYISTQAAKIGTTSEEIKKRLSENYSFNDIDSVCEKLQAYRIGMQSLPFDMRAKNSLKMRITESKETLIPESLSESVLDDDIDATLSSFMK